jgi:fumarate reductase (CoM/CoB) subunit B
VSQINITVFRYDPQEDSKSRYEEYPVAYHEGMRIWKALDNINEKERANIAWRLSCREYLCGSCTIMINGQPGLACKTAVEDGMVLEPLPYFPIVKDLLINRDTAESRMKKLSPWLLRQDDISRREMILHQSDLLGSKEMTQCVQCLACLAVCPALRGAWEEFNGPMYQTIIARAAYNPLDTANRVAEAARYGMFNCTQCGACREVCPKSIEIPEKAIGQMKTLFAREEEGLEVVERVSAQVRFKSNPFDSDDPKWKWAEGLDLPKKGDTLFFAGCLSSYKYPETLKACINLLRKVGINPAYFAEKEMCCGEPLLRLGNEAEFIKNGLDFVEACHLAGVKQVITPCAEGFRSFTINYPRYLKDKELPQFKHITQVLAENTYKLQIKGNLDGVKVTYHDPCRLGRDCKVYDEPRALINELKGLELLEMKKNRVNTVCCGAGGGVKLFNNDIAQWMGMNRLKMAEETGSSLLITACPWCEWNFDDAGENGNGMRVKNIIDLIHETV